MYRDDYFLCTRTVSRGYLRSAAESGSGGRSANSWGPGNVSARASDYCPRALATNVAAAAATDFVVVL